MYKNPVKCFAVLFLLLINFTAVHAQPNQRAMLDSIAGKLLREIQSNQDDRIYLHYDKPYYQAGTNIWFRAYLLKDLSGRVSGNRNNVYVTLTNDQDSCISQVILNSAERDWEGSLAIPLKTPEGFYTINAFTNRMATMGMDKSFSEQIYILNKKSGIVITSFPEIVEVNAKGDPIIRFYPEGGSLVNGIDNRVAFEALDSTGIPVAVQGRLIDDNQKTITTFAADVKGKGIMVFPPVKNRTYTAVVKSATGSDLKFTLPPVNYKACQLNVVSQNEKTIRLRVVLGDSLYAKKPVSFIVGVAGDKVCYASIGDGMYETTVPLANFPYGPATFYVFDGNQKKQGERRVFVDKKNVQFLVQADKENYAPRQNANITMQISDKDGKPLQSIFSISVTDDSVVEWPLLRAAENSGAASDSVDLLKKLPEVLSQSVNTQEQGDSGIILAGIIKDQDGSPKEWQVITLVEEGNNRILTDTTDAGGRFSFPPFDFIDQTPFFTQVTDLKGAKQDVVVFTDPLSFNIPAGKKPGVIRWSAFPAGLNKFRQTEADSLLTGTLKNQFSIILNKELNTGKKSKSKMAERSVTSLMLTGEQLDKLGQGNTYNAILLQPGVKIIGGKLTIRDGTQSVGRTSGDIEPLLIIDDVPGIFTNVSFYLNSIPPKNIEYIKLITGIEALRYGARAVNGVILVKTANMLRTSGASDQKGIQYVFPVGYQKKQSFYVPPYESNVVREASFTDNRATIYWNGEILTDIQGKASFKFYTADSPSTYTIRIRGVSSKGDMIDESVRINRN